MKILIVEDEPKTACGSSELDPGEFVGGFDGAAIACGA
jgi:hypothetical protein